MDLRTKKCVSLDFSVKCSPWALILLEDMVGSPLLDTFCLSKRDPLAQPEVTGLMKEPLGEIPWPVLFGRPD